MNPDLRVGGSVRRSRISDRRHEILASSTLYRSQRYTIFYMTSSFHCGEFNMDSTDAFALRRSGLSEFLFAPVGTEANGMTLSVVSLLARQGNDPWQEAGRLAGLPKTEATESLALIIASMPTSVWPQQAATTIATRLIALLPMQAENPGQSPSASAYGEKAGRIVRIGLALAAAVAFAVAFQTGVFTTLNNSDPGGNSVAGFAVAPR